MRYLALLLLLMGCGPVCAAPPKNETIVQALERYDALSVKRDEAMAAKVDGLAETVGNATAELEAVKEELRGLKSLLTVDAEPAVPVPPAEKPVQVDAPPVESAGQRVTFQGKPIDVQAWLRRSVTLVEIHGDVDKHLRDHGLDGDFSGFSRPEKIRLHSVAHSYRVPLKSSARPPVVMNAAVILPRSSNCANGNCARPQYGYTQRRGMFGGRAWR